MAESEGRRFTRVQLGYRLNDHGLITSPGKFEGEMYYVPQLWEEVLNGFAAEMNDGSARIELGAEDWQRFPELRGWDYVRLYESDSGFVTAVLRRKKRR